MPSPNDSDGPTLLERSIAEQRDDAGDRRDQAGGRRDCIGSARDDAADRRDQSADERDRAADRRDQLADLRDVAADERDKASERSEVRFRVGPGPWAASRTTLDRRVAAADRSGAAQDRRAGARERHHAVRDRSTSSADRHAGAGERTDSEQDRETSFADRGASARDRDDSSMDFLTGVFVRRAGWPELERRIAAARRDCTPVVLAFVDVDHLKSINDTDGHAAGDRMLLEVATTLRASLGPDDLILRYGGDEFVCLISARTVAEVVAVFGRIGAILASGPQQGSVSVGIAELLDDEDLEHLVARADTALYRFRDQRGGSHQP